MKESVVGKFLACKAEHIVGCQIKHAEYLILSIKKTPLSQAKVVLNMNYLLFMSIGYLKLRNKFTIYLHV